MTSRQAAARRWARAEVPRALRTIELALNAFEDPKNFGKLFGLVDFPFLPSRNGVTLVKLSVSLNLCVYRWNQ